VVYSHYLAAVCHMGNRSYQTGKPVNWNPAWDLEAIS
jgi:hypothetical protein